MARLFALVNNSTSDAAHINEPYAHIYGNILAYALDGLGSQFHEHIYTDPFATDTGSLKTNVAWGAGSFGRTGSDAGSLVLNAISLGSTFKTIVPYVQGSFYNPYNLYFSFDNGTTYTEYFSRRLGSCTGVTGSGIKVKFHIGNANTGSDVILGVGFYYA